MEKYTLPTDPLPNPSAVVVGDNYRFTLISDTILRYEWSEDGIFEDRPSTFAINRRFPVPKYSVTSSEGHLDIRTSSYQVTYNKKRFDRYGLIISFNNKNTLWGADWRYGEKVPENLGGTARTLDEVNGRCELEPGVLSRAGYSVFDDSKSMLFDADGFAAPRRPGDRIDGYLFCYGFDYKRAMKSFFAISGKQPMLPRWSLGNWWSRYYAYTDEEYLKLMDKFRDEKVPLSVAVIDMDWHQVSGDHIPHAGWTGYTWEKKYFPDPKAFTDALHKRKLKVTLNDHPHAGVHHHEDLYEAMAKDIGHDTSSNAPILFNPTDPKFMHSYLNTLHRSLEKDGCDFWWIDWQQGPYSRVPGLDPLWLLNHFHFLDHEQQKGKDQAIIFSRYGGPGSHRYPVGFSGDSIMTWESLAFQPEFTATASNIGYGWWSHDIGGHMQGYRDDELATRWVQLGVFSPLMRLHSSNSAWGSKEPWLFRKEYGEVMREFLRVRHRMLPYLYSMNVLSAEEDEPIVQPLYWKFPARDEAYSKPNQFYFGSSLIVAPIVEPRSPSTNKASVNVWLPPGRHVDIMNGLVYDGDRDIRMYRELKEMPVIAPEGSIIPLDGADNLSNGGANPVEYEVLVVVGKDGSFTIHEDIRDDEQSSLDGNQKKRAITIEYKQDEGLVKFNSSGKDWTFKFVSLEAAPSLSMVVDNDEVPDVKPTKDSDLSVPGLVVRVPKSSGADVPVSIYLGKNPQLSSPSLLDSIEACVLDAQMDMDAKDRVWRVVKGPQTPAVKIGQLMTLGLGEALTGPLVELLSANSRQD